MGGGRRWVLPSTDCPSRDGHAAGVGTVAGVDPSASRSPRPRLPQLPALLGPLLLALLVTACRAQGEPATVVSVGDGDTLRVRVAGELRSVRLACIDAPELSQRPEGPWAREQLRQLAPIGATVLLQVKASDRYGRLVAEVSTSRNLNLALLERGAAFIDPAYVHQCDASAYGAAERLASSRRLGVWRLEGGISRPWLVRRQRRQRP